MQRSLVGHSPWGHLESDSTERLTHKGNQKEVRWALRVGSKMSEMN